MFLWERQHGFPEQPSTMLLLHLPAMAMLLSVSLHVATAAFRPPAIPLFTTDPYMQTWVMGDNTTADVVRHWDQTTKEMLGLLRVGSKAYRFLGACATQPPPLPSKPMPATVLKGHNVATGQCDLVNYHMEQTEAGAAKCNELCSGNPDCVAFVMSHANARCFLKSCDHPITKDMNTDGFILKPGQFLSFTFARHCDCCCATGTACVARLSPSRHPTLATSQTC